jgi:hypothetical protein
MDNNADVGGDDFDADEDFIWDKTLWIWIKFFYQFISWINKIIF